ncbi:MAG: hypothetical protein GKS06_10170 [Acidobacteria bacterium]|nr:hypothetical protein [Acidobacteriota bacterium]
MPAKVLDFPRPGGEVKRHRAVLPRQAMPDVDCAFCGSSETEPTSMYGCHMLTSQYFCHSCRTTFDRVRGD